MLDCARRIIESCGVQSYNHRQGRSNRRMFIRQCRDDRSKSLYSNGSAGYDKQRDPWMFNSKSPFYVKPRIDIDL